MAIPFAHAPDSRWRQPASHRRDPAESELSAPRVTRRVTLTLGTGILSMLAACQRLGATPPAQKGPVTLRFLASAPPEPQERVYRGIISDFQQANPRFTINFEPISGSYIYDKIAAELVAGTAWDVIENHYGKITEYAYNDQLLDLTSYYARDKKLFDDVFAPAVEAAERWGKQWAVTFVAQPQAIYVNLSMFRARGIAPPTRDWTIDQYTSIVQRLTNKSEQQWGTAVGAGDWWLWWTFVFGAFSMDPTEKKVLMDSPEMLRVWRWYYGDMLRYSPTPDEQAELGSPDKLFGLGKLGTLQLGSWVFGSLLKTIENSFEWTLQEVPTAPDGKKHVAMSSRALCAPHFTKTPDEVWEFMRFFAFSPQAGRWLSETGNVPVVKSVANSDVYIQPQVLGGAKRVFAREMEYAISSATRQYPAGIELYGFQKPYQDAQQAILRGEKGIDQAVREAQDQMQRAVDEHWRRAAERQKK